MKHETYEQLLKIRDDENAKLRSENFYLKEAIDNYISKTNDMFLIIQKYIAALELCKEQRNEFINDKTRSLMDYKIKQILDGKNDLDVEVFNETH